MKKTICAVLEVDTDDSLDFIKNDIGQELSCAINRYNVVLIQEVQDFPKWISVEERLPSADEGDDFLAVSKNGNFVFEAYFERDCTYGKNLWHDGCGHFYKISHWMPLPEPPKED